MEQQLEQIFSDFRGKRSDLIPILQKIQDVLGFVPCKAMKATADFLNIPESSVYGLITFYSQFYLTKPGKHKIRVCEGTACHVRGSQTVVDAISDRLSIKPGETSEDQMFTIERVACVGSCALAPAVVVDKKVHGAMDAPKINKVIDRIFAAEAGDEQREGE